MTTLGNGETCDYCDEKAVAVFLDSRYCWECMEEECDDQRS